MKNKDKYDLRYITIKPKYMINGCGKKIKDNFTFDIYYYDEVVAKDIIAKERAFKYFMRWLEQE